jgi:hypothetical protein
VTKKKGKKGRGRGGGTANPTKDFFKGKMAQSCQVFRGKKLKSPYFDNELQYIAKT